MNNETESAWKNYKRYFGLWKKTWNRYQHWSRIFWKASRILDDLYIKEVEARNRRDQKHQIYLDEKEKERTSK